MNIRAGKIYGLSQLCSVLKKTISVNFINFVFQQIWNGNRSRIRAKLLVFHKIDSNLPAVWSGHCTDKWPVTSDHTWFGENLKKAFRNRIDRILELHYTIRPHLFILNKRHPAKSRLLFPSLEKSTSPNRYLFVYAWRCEEISLFLFLKRVCVRCTIKSGKFHKVHKKPGNGNLDHWALNLNKASQKYL